MYHVKRGLIGELGYNSKGLNFGWYIVLFFSLN